jgi:DNA-binding NarL/FixJ family response regulator
MRILLADDHPLVLLGVRRVFEEDPGFEVVGEAHTGIDVLPLVERTDPDVVLLDMRMPDLDGLSCLERIRARHSNVKVVFLSVSNGPRQIRAALAQGASGYIGKGIDPAKLPSAVREAVEGVHLSIDGPAHVSVEGPDVDEAALASAVGLTKREMSIVKAVARGLSNRAIAQELWVTEQTVKFHLTNIYRKLGTPNRTAAAQWVYEQGLAEMPSNRARDAGA